MKKKLLGPILAIVVISIFLVSAADPYNLLQFIFYFIMIISAGIYFAIRIFSPSGDRKLMVISAISGTIILAVAVIYLTPTRGVPFPVYASNFGQTCTTTTIGNSIQSGCSPTFSAPYVSPVNIIADLLFWFPLIGSFVYGMPYWEQGDPKTEKLVLSKLAKILTSSAVIGWYMFEFALPAMPYGYLSFTKGLEPLKLYVAFADCDSTTFNNGDCVTVNIQHLLFDYYYWILVSLIVILIASELLASSQEYRRRRTNHNQGSQKHSTVESPLVENERRK